MVSIEGIICKTVLHKSLEPQNISSFTISNQIDSQEDLSISLRQAEALTYMALRDDFEDAPSDLKRYYLWVLSDIISQAQQINAQCVADLMRFYQSI